MSDLTREQIEAWRQLGADYLAQMIEGEAMFERLCDMALKTLAPSAIGEPRVEAEAMHPENKVAAALMIACSRVPAEYGLLVNREFWNLLRGSNMKREKDDA